MTCDISDCRLIGHDSESLCSIVRLRLSEVNRWSEWLVAGDLYCDVHFLFFFFQAEDGIRDVAVTGVQTCALPISHPLAEEGPVYHRPIARPAPRVESEKDWFPFAPEATNLTPNFLRLLASPTLASKRWITEQYDTSVRTNTLAGPGASDAAVVRIKDPKTNEVKRALALSTDGNGRWCQLNPHLGAMHAVAEAARNVAEIGRAHV